MTPDPIEYAGLSTSRPARTIIPPLTLWLVALLCVAAIASVYYGRVIIGPSDLYRKDQCKTMAYTVDMVLNHRFSLPRDVIFQPATKPPLFNWLAAIGVAITGQFGEWAQKWPSMAGAVAVAGIVFAFCRRQFGKVIDSQDALLIALFASAIWISTKATVLLLYIARPDMVQALCLIGGWYAANRAFEFDHRRAARTWAAWFWCATTAAALAKGPAAVYPMLYALLAPILIFANWRKLGHLYWHIGVPVLLASVGAWLLFAYLQDAEHVTGVLLGTEVYKRIASSNPEGFIKPWYFAIQWFIMQNQYWSYLVIGSMIVGLLGSLRRAMGIRREIPLQIARPRIGDPEYLKHAAAGHDRPTTLEYESTGSRDRSLAERFFDLLRIRNTDGFFTGAAGMANLWVWVVVGCLSIPADKRQDFLLPAHPGSAILAAHFLVYLVARFQIMRWLLPLGAGLVLLWEKRIVTDMHVAIVAGVFAVLVAIASMIHKRTPALIVPLAWVVLAGFIAFEVATNTRLGIYKTAPLITFICFFGGAALAASLMIFAYPRARLELPLIACGIIFWGYALLQNNYKDTGLPGSTNPSLYATRFATEAKKLVGDEKVVSIFRSKHPILTLMGRHQGSYLTRKDFEEAQWVIVERSKFPRLMDSEQEKLFSGKIDVEFGHIKELGHKIMKDRVALIRIDKEKNVPSVDELIAIHLWAQDWTTDDANPYRSANTGWIDTPGQPTPPKWTPPPGDPWFNYAKPPERLDAQGNPIDTEE